MQESGVRAAMDRTALLRANAPGYASVALANIAREFPADVWHTFRGPEDLRADPASAPRSSTAASTGTPAWRCTGSSCAMACHAAAALPHAVGDDYMVEHWLAAYAVLLLA